MIFTSFVFHFLHGIESDRRSPIERQKAQEPKTIKSNELQTHTLHYSFTHTEV